MYNGNSEKSFRYESEKILNFIYLHSIFLCCYCYCMMQTLCTSRIRTLWKYFAFMNLTLLHDDRHESTKKWNKIFLFIWLKFFFCLLSEINIFIRRYLFVIFVDAFIPQMIWSLCSIADILHFQNFYFSFMKSNRTGILKCENQAMTSIIFSQLLIRFS